MSVSLNLHLSLLPFLGVFSFCLFWPIPIYLFLLYLTILYFILLSPLICYLFPKERQKEGNSEQDRGGRNWEEQRERRRQSEYNVWKTAICNKRKIVLTISSIYIKHFCHVYLIFLSPVGILLSLSHYNVFYFLIYLVYVSMRKR